MKKQPKEKRNEGNGSSIEERTHLRRRSNTEMTPGFGAYSSEHTEFHSKYDGARNERKHKKNERERERERESTHGTLRTKSKAAAQTHTVRQCRLQVNTNGRESERNAKSNREESAIVTKCIHWDGGDVEEARQDQCEGGN